jgi:spermidine synthase
MKTPPAKFNPTVILTALLTGLAIYWAISAQTQVVYETESEYNTIVVTEDQAGLRTLLFQRNGARQSVVKLDDPSHIELAYVRAMLVSLALVDSPERILIVGLGGGSLPTFLHHHYPNASIDVVDIDPEVVRVARQFFGFQPDARLRAHVADGRKFIEQTEQPYDLILLDAYGAESIPLHLATREFLQAVRRALTARGIVVGNIWSRSSNRLYDSMVNTYRDVFDRLYLLEARGAGNVIFFGLSRPETLQLDLLMRRAETVTRQLELPFALEDEMRYGFSSSAPHRTNARILRDGEEP